MHVDISLKQNHFVGVLDQEYQNIGIPAAEVQVQDALVLKQVVSVLINAGAIMLLRHPVAVLDALDDIE